MVCARTRCHQLIALVVMMGSSVALGGQAQHRAQGLEPNQNGRKPAEAASSESGTAQELTALLRQFLEDAGQGNRAGFEKFFADDLIYTRSTGVVLNKAEILQGVERLKPTAESKTTYAAGDIVVHVYGDMAVVAFRLEGRTEKADGKVEASHNRNTGTFLRRGGVWQVVAWQSTRIAETEGKSK